MAKTRHQRKIRHDKFLARLASWKAARLAQLVYTLSQPETLIWFLLAAVFFMLAILSHYSRPAQIQNLITQAESSLNRGDYVRAHQTLSQAVLLDNTNPQIHFALSLVYQKTNNYPEAKKELLLALEVSPDSATILKELNKVQATLQAPGKINEEIKYWEKEVTLKPDYRDGYIQLAVRYFELYRTEEAKKAIEKAYTLDPNFQTTKKLREIIK